MKMNKMLFKRQSSTKHIWKLASKKRWDDLLVQLATTAGKRQAQTPDFTGAYLLHQVITCRDAPAALVRVVEELVNIYPEALLTRDVAGMLPIHVAAGVGSSIRIVEALLKAAPEEVANEMTVAEDEMGRTPLHHAVRFACKDERQLYPQKEHMDLIMAFYGAAPENLYAPDADGESPLDIVLRHGELGLAVATMLKSREQGANSLARQGNIVGHSLTHEKPTNNNPKVHAPQDMQDLRELLDWARRQQSRNRLSRRNLSRPPAA
mmetsp:Transcript_18416/g.53097  ORF Transcript_18416/g.53097 Transcript_18416/m.53097 type:complete len:265 (-) Transcript_18416:145-939(-)